MDLIKGRYVDAIEKVKLDDDLELITSFQAAVAKRLSFEIMQK